jgi:hypothetical protein
MKAIRLLLVSFFVLILSTTNVVASNESDTAKIKRAIRAAPNSISDHATIMDADGTILREGSDDGKSVCFPGVPLIDGDKHPMCDVGQIKNTPTCWAYAYRSELKAIHRKSYPFTVTKTAML